MPVKHRNHHVRQFHSHPLDKGEKTILVTGAATGLGQATAIGLAQAGHKVIATVENWPQVNQLRADADAAGVDLVVEKLDYLQPDDHDTVLRKYGEKVDIAVLNAPPDRLAR